jgi:prepilin-type N-terminal cleavage/methylation domain-containing protein
MKNNIKGFTLLELSIVLIIVGLIAAGVLGGQDLIRESELNSIATDLSKLQSAYNQYKQKYNAVPGDHVDAFNYFGTNCASTAANCNGVGDNDLSDAPSSRTLGEGYMFFRHLFLANLYEQDLNGTQSTPPVIGTNVAELSTAGDSFFAYTWYKLSFFVAGSGSASTSQSANILSIGKIASASTWPDTVTFSPEEAKRIDAKIDDGQPGTGIVIAGNQSSGCASSATMKSATYTVATTTEACKLGLILEEPI